MLDRGLKGPAVSMNQELSVAEARIAWGEAGRRALCALLGWKGVVFLSYKLSWSEPQGCSLKVRVPGSHLTSTNQIFEERILEFMSLNSLQVFLMIDQIWEILLWAE